MPNPKPHNDLPTLEDDLHWDNELERLCNRIRTCDTPHVMGIHGDWGSGKTSFMRQLQLRLGGEIPDDGSVTHLEKCLPEKDREQLQQQTLSIWFDAWRYQHEPVPVVALLQEMRRQMPLLPAMREKLKKLGNITARYLLHSIGDAGKLIGIEGLPNAEKIEKLGEGWEKDNFAAALTVDSIRSHLHETIKCLLPEDNSRLVIFIDDLDRCNPKAAFRLLEGLKIYLSLPNCVFVLGMNERILTNILGEEIYTPETASKDQRAAHYLEKICSDIYRLPMPENATALFSNWISDENHRLALREAISQTRCLPPNPRRLKALFNQWQRFSQCIDMPTETNQRPAWAARVLVAAYIHQFHRDLWERWHFNPDFWNELASWCCDEHATDEKGNPIRLPAWATTLKLTERIDGGMWLSDFPNPGDINIFWADGLIRAHRDQLNPTDFTLLLQGKRQTTTAKP